MAKDWRSVALWLVLIKVGYLAAVCSSVTLWSDFDEATSSAINAWWFDATAQSVPEGSTGLARHFATWDAQHYLFLSGEGYSSGVKSCAFYPLWPLAIRWFSVLTGGSHLIAGIVLANIFSLAAWMIFYHIVARRFGKSAALWALVFLIIFPGSLFYQFVYSEPLFFLLVMLLWLGLERNHYKLAWAAAFLLPLTRAIGVFNVLPIYWHWLMRQQWGWLQHWRWLDADRERLRRDGLAKPVDLRWQVYALMAAPPLGLALYFALMWGWTGNALEGFEAQKFWSAHSINNLWNVPKFVIGWFSPSSVHAFRGSMLDRLVFLLLLFTLPLVWRLGKDLVVWTYLLGILPAMSGTFTSFTRFASCAFPMFIALAVFSEGQRWPWLKWALLVGFGVLHIILLWRFVNFRWAG